MSGNSLMVFNFSDGIPLSVFNSSELNFFVNFLGTVVIFMRYCAWPFLVDDLPFHCKHLDQLLKRKSIVECVFNWLVGSLQLPYKKVKSDKL